jgi:sigma-B regulation protein RsbU (phosphoserine phosphatase)
MTGAAPDARPDAAPQPPLLFELTVPAQAGRLKLVRAALRQAAADLDWPDDAAQDLVLAVDEACQNVVRHAYGGTGEGPLTVRACGDAARITVRLIDAAPTVDPATIRPRALDDLRPGGLGTRLMRELVDEIAFETPDAASQGPHEGGNVLRLTKRAG